jgi:hypothetical protein
MINSTLNNGRILALSICIDLIVTELSFCNKILQQTFLSYRSVYFKGIWTHEPKLSLKILAVIRVILADEDCYSSTELLGMTDTEWYYMKL